MTSELNIVGKNLVRDLVARSNRAHRSYVTEPKPEIASRLDIESSVYWDAANLVADATSVARPDPKKPRS